MTLVIMNTVSSHEPMFIGDRFISLNRFSALNGRPSSNTIRAVPSITGIGPRSAP